MAEKACHVFASATQVGLTQPLGLQEQSQQSPGRAQSVAGIRITHHATAIARSVGESSPASNCKQLSLRHQDQDLQPANAGRARVSPTRRTACPDSSPENPLSRAIDCLLQHGKPFNRLNKCFFLDQSGTLRWLGIFIHSRGDRILFFPGITEYKNHVVAYNGDSLRWDQSFKIDHISLEPDWESWHFTEPASAQHLGKMYAHKLSQDVRHWFSMSVRANEDLRITRRETRVLSRSSIHSGDIDRRIKELGKSREDAEFPIISLNEQSQLDQPNFVHFSVVIGPPNFTSPGQHIFGLPYGSPFVDASSGTPTENIPCRAHRCKLSDTAELEIISAVLPGTLKKDFLYSESPRVL